MTPGKPGRSGGAREGAGRKPRTFRLKLGEGGHPFINLTPHEIVLVNQNGTISHIYPSGDVARVEVEYFVSDFPCYGVEVADAELGQVVGLPPRQEGKLYLVSAMVAQATSRADLLAPDTGPTAIRENGQVKAVTRLLRYRPVVTIPVEDAIELAHFIDFACSGYTMTGNLPHGYGKLRVNA